jgi:hypothetical protein
MKVETADSYGYGVQFGSAVQPQLANGLHYPGYSQWNGSQNASNSAGPSGAGYYNQGDSAPPTVPQHLPPLPPKDNVPALRTPIKLGNTPVTAPASGEGGKRKSWFKRFSRSN